MGGMEMQRLAVRLLNEGIEAPAHAHEGDAGLDLRAAETITLQPHERAVVGTGLAVAVPEGHGGLVLPRSGLASQHGVTVANAPGLIDSGYRGELKVALVNLDEAMPFTVERGMRIAQLLVIEVPRMKVEVCESLPKAADERGEGGFGSSGVA